MNQIRWSGHVLSVLRAASAVVAGEGGWHVCASLRGDGVGYPPASSA